MAIPKSGHIIAPRVQPPETFNERRENLVFTGSQDGQHSSQNPMIIGAGRASAGNSGTDEGIVVDALLDWQISSPQGISTS
jgi:hypothetical protein